MRSLVVLVLFLSNTPLFAGWHDRKAEGWAWYEEKKQPKEEESKPDQVLNATEQMS
jgi:hypothetical protein